MAAAEHPTGKAPEDRTRLENRFWSKVDIQGPGECWEWTHGTFPTGYGAFQYGGAKRAHRIAWELTGGPSIPQDKQLNHTCDNRACVSPHHLYLGTQRDNLMDAVRRERRPGQLPLDTVREIRERYREEDVTQTELADEFGVSQSEISRIVRGEVFEFLEDE